MGNAALAIQLLMGLLDRASAIGGLLSRATAERRDVSDAELDQLAKEDDAAKAAHAAAIAKARAEGR